MIPGRIRPFLKPAILLVLLVAASLLLIHSLIERPAVQSYLLEKISRVTGYHVSVERIELHLWGGLGFQAEDVKVASDSGAWKLDAARLILNIDVARLLKGEIAPTAVSLYRPRIEIAGAQSAPRVPESPADPLERVLKAMPVFPDLIIREGSASIRGSPSSMEGLYVHIHLHKEKKKEWQRVVLKGKLVSGGTGVPFQVSGTSTMGDKSDLLLDMHVTVEDFPFEWIPWPDEVEMERGTGTAQFHVRAGPEQGLSAEGKMTGKALSFSVIEDGASKDYRLRRVLMDFEVSYLAGIFAVQSMRLSGRDFTLSVVSRLDLNNSPSPHFFLRVESPFMPIETLKNLAPTSLLPEWIEAKLSPSLSKGFVRVDAFQLDGTIRRIEDLAMPENSGVLSMELTWKGLDVALSGGGLPFREVSGKISLDGDRINIRRVKGDFGVSSVRNASMEVNNIYKGTPSYIISVKGLFNIQDLLRQREAALVPRDVQRYLRRIEPVAGNVKADVRILYSEEMEHPQLIEGSFFFEECTATQEALFYPLVLDKLHLVMKKDARNVFEAQGRWGPALFTAKGVVEEGWKRGRARIEADADPGTLLKEFKIWNESVLKLSEAISGRVLLSWDDNGISCSGSVTLGEASCEGPNFCLFSSGKDDRIDFSVDLDGENRLHIRTLKGHLGTSTLELKGTYDLKSDRFHKVTLSTPSLSLSDLGLRRKFRDMGAQGEISGELEIRPRGPDLQEPLITGRVSGRGISFAPQGLPSPVRDGSFTARFLGNKVLIPSMTFRTGASDLSVQGTLGGWSRLEGTLSARSRYLRLSDFFDFQEESGVAGTGEEMNRFWRESDVHMDLEVLAGSWRELDFGPSRAECRLRKGEFQVSRSRVNLEYGKVDLRARFAPREGGKKYLDTDFRLINQPLGEILESFELGREAIEGRLFLAGSIRMEGRDTHELLSSMEGNATVGLEEGKIRKSNILLKVLNFLSLRQIFQSVPEDLPKEGFYYKIISSTVDIQGGVVRSEDFFMKSPVFDALGRGEVDLGGDRVAFDLGISPFGTIDDLLNKIPVVGYILTGEEKSVLVYYFKIDGPLSDPNTRYIPLKKFGGNTVDFFKRLLKTPVLIYKEIAGEKEGREQQ